MTWIKPLKQAEIKELEIYDELKQPVDVFMRLLANDPELLKAFVPLQRAVKSAPFPEVIKEIVITFVSLRNGCQYCTKSHGLLLKELTADEDILAKLDQYESANFSEEIKTILRYAEKLTAKPVQVRQEDLEAIKQFGYNDKQIFQLNQLIAYTSYTNQISIGLGL
ncbi:carboxymuconolactone decarboxylase family protein [Brevibacillus sp. H7]|uniref:carboxymuconolactone decarboxylase family protein n=1 Tax=Brevibacillus sp. H7 TaxID=3349138 RepID=UPI00381C8BAE